MIVIKSPKKNNNNKMFYFFLRSHLWRHKVLSYFNTAIEISHLKAQVTHSLTILIKTYPDLY